MQDFVHQQFDLGFLFAFGFCMLGFLSGGGGGGGGGGGAAAGGGRRGGGGGGGGGGRGYSHRKPYSAWLETATSADSLGFSKFTKGRRNASRRTCHAQSRLAHIMLQVARTT